MANDHAWIRLNGSKSKAWIYSLVEIILSRQKMNIRDYMDAPNSRQLRPINSYGDDTPGVGERLFEFGGKKILVINALGVAYMKMEYANPFPLVDAILAKYKDEQLEAILVDFHNIRGVCNGKLSQSPSFTLVGNSYPRSDCWCGESRQAGWDLSLIWLRWCTQKSNRCRMGDLEASIYRGTTEGLMSPDENGPWVLSGMYAEIVDKKCITIEPFRILE